MRWEYQKGLHELGNGSYAWLAPDGTWGWSNAGLIVDSGESLLVDTLFDLRMTQEMLDSMRSAEPQAAASIGTLVNTHANGDHCHGNELVHGAEVIASKASAEEMAEVTPEMLAGMMDMAADGEDDLSGYLRHCFGAFDFHGIRHTPPTRTFTKNLSLDVGNKKVELIEVGPAHTRGDVLVHVPEDRTVFTGDILFIGGTPIMWAGPVERWIDACRRIEEMDVETVVPGHGPITDAQGAAEVRGYLEWLRAEARDRFDAGMEAVEAAKDIALGPYADWSDAERIAVNVHTMFQDFAAKDTSPSTLELFSSMATLREFQTRSIN